jgi:hypothetical protein
MLRTGNGKLERLLFALCAAAAKGDVTADSHNVARGRESCARKKCADVVDLNLDAKEKFR